MFLGAVGFGAMPMRRRTWFFAAATLVVASVSCAPGSVTDEDRGEPTGGATASISSGPTFASSSTAATKTFSKVGVSFRYPSDWNLGIISEGPSAGCAEGFWFAFASVGESGALGVSRCPSSFSWPPEGQSASEALRAEIVARNQGDLGEIVELREDQLGGMTGVATTVTLTPRVADQFGISGQAHGTIARGATIDVPDPRKPDIYEVFCLALLGDPARVQAACGLIISSFELD